MKDLATDRERSRRPTDDLPDAHHIVCCHDDGLGLCGSDLRDTPWGRQDGEDNCRVCFEIEELNGDGPGPCHHCPLNVFPHSATWGAS